MGPDHWRAPRQRHGAALLLALTLIILTAAVLAGTFASAHAAARTTGSREAMALADAQGSAAAAAFLAGWNASMDSLPVGSEFPQATIASTHAATGGSAQSALRLVRLDSLRFLLAVLTQVGPSGIPRAVRRSSILLEYPPITDSTAPRPPPRPVGRWPVSRLH